MTLANRMLVTSMIVAVLCLWAMFASGMGVAKADHFRYGHISWVPGEGNTIQFTLRNAFRRSFDHNPAYRCMDPATFVFTPCSAADGLPAPGDVFRENVGGTVLSTGDGMVIDGPFRGGLFFVVTSIDPTNEWLFASALDPTSLPAIDTVIDHTYDAPGNYVASVGVCCRLSRFSGVNEHINNPDGRYRVETMVNVGSGNSPPVTVLPPIVICPKDGLCSFAVPAADPNGDALRFRLSDETEAGSGFTQPGPPHAPNTASIDPATGQYAWDTTGATHATASDANTLYSTQVTIEDLDGAGNVKSKIAVDFFILLTTLTGDPPVVNSSPGAPACGSSLTVNSGSTLTFPVESSDPDPGQTVTLNAVGLPPGARMTPPLPTSGNPVSSTFTWTPTEADQGVTVITFTATDDSSQQAGRQTVCSIAVLAAPPNKCPLSQGFWKNHEDNWPADSLVLGDRSYAQDELVELLRTPTRGDASLILAHQLIAAKLNIAHGSDPTPVRNIVNEADDLLSSSGGTLRHRMKSSSLSGRQMTDLAQVLDEYNNGLLTSDCEPSNEAPQ